MDYATRYPPIRHQIFTDYSYDSSPTPMLAFARSRPDYPSPISSDPSPGPHSHFDNSFDNIPFNSIHPSIGPVRISRRSKDLVPPIRSPSPDDRNSPYHPATPNSMPRDSPTFHPYPRLRLSDPYPSPTPQDLSDPFPPLQRRDNSPTHSLSSSSSGHHNHDSSDSQQGKSSTQPQPQESKRPSRVGKVKPHKKTRLPDSSKKAICQYYLDNKTERQEDIAARFHVERSTISKILKDKDRWLSITPEEEAEGTSKHRPSKFPEIETRLIDSLKIWSESGTPITDALIRNRSLEIAEEYGMNLAKFKGSAGWVENVKNRLGIKKGEWVNRGSYERSVRDALDLEVVKQDSQALEIETMYGADPRSFVNHSNVISPACWGGPTLHPDTLPPPDLDPQVPAIPGGVNASLDDADHAANILVTFFNSEHGRGILRGNELETLITIKGAILEALSGVYRDPD